MRRIWALSIVALLVCTFLSVVPAGTVLAAPHSTAKAQAGCWGASCYNKDPFQMGCQASSTRSTVIKDADGTIAKVWNEYASNCNANWTEGELLGKGFNLSITISASGEKALCYPDNCTSVYNGTAIAWTNMVDGTHVTSSTAKATSPAIFPDTLDVQISQ